MIKHLKISSNIIFTLIKNVLNLFKTLYKNSKAINFIKIVKLFLIKLDLNCKIIDYLLDMRC